MGGAALSGLKFSPALRDVSPDLGIAHLQIVLELVDVHQAGQRDAVFLEDDVLLVDMHALDDGAEGVARFAEGEALDRRTRLRGSDSSQLLSGDGVYIARHRSTKRVRELISAALWRLAANVKNSERQVLL
jgi:hypothetical protein